jgi:integrase/recombinase XerD
MLTVGLRAAEVLALTVYDIEWLSGKLTVRQGKGKKDRIL